MPKRRKFERPLGKRRYRRLFVIAVEGAITEKQYFNAFRSQETVISVQCLAEKSNSAPPQVLKRMQKHLRNARLRNCDEAWLVVDKDHWTDEQLGKLWEWSQQESNYGFALSNPDFE